MGTQINATETLINTSYNEVPFTNLQDKVDTPKIYWYPIQHYTTLMKLFLTVNPPLLYHFPFPETKVTEDMYVTQLLYYLPLYTFDGPLIRF